MNSLPIKKDVFYPANDIGNHYILLLPCLLIAAFMGWLIAYFGFTVAGLFIALPILIGFLILVFLNPRVGFISFLVYSFLMPGIGRHFIQIQVGLGIDALLLITWLAVIFYRGKKYRYRQLKNDLIWLSLVWFMLTVLQIGNPARPNIVGWLQESRTVSLYWVMVIPLTMLVFNKKSDIYVFTDLIIFLSLLGALYGMKQLYIGMDSAEQLYLQEHLKTHMLYGKVRIFSYYLEAAQFGASQASIVILCFILVFGPHSRVRRICYAIAGLIIFYGMLLSGTRGALAGILGGGLVFLVLSKQLKIILLGGGILLGFIGMLKFTKIGHGNDQIRRMRSGTDVKDASFQLRLINQKILSNALQSKPFGTGPGTSGAWGNKYNAHISTSKIAPDSLFVKIWVMYGITGFILWLGIMLYILGKSVGLIWNTRDPLLRNQLCALCGVYVSILVCSYGNEVMNNVPSLTIVYISWALISMSTRWDIPLPKSTLA